MSLHFETRRLAVIVLLFAAAVMGAAGANPEERSSKKPIAFSGRVESVDLKMGTVAVRHGAIPGFMPAMTLDYMIDDAAVLKQLSPADEITATVYVGDPALYAVRIVGHNSSHK